MGRGFGGRIARTIRESTPWWPAPPTPREQAPNVVVVLLDDMGFSDFGCFGGEMSTPTVDRLAA
ncbi:MAG: sulfatase-like hydrolase/transferase, partial [Actinomycetota bacterium]|nr:sulfatase-like hydrolase/transferase [Actinomycetota bacterium]